MMLCEYTVCTHILAPLARCIFHLVYRFAQTVSKHFKYERGKAGQDSPNQLFLWINVNAEFAASGRNWRCCDKCENVAIEARPASINSY